MTDLSPETALALLASHGADLARWPADAGAALPALAARDARVAAALAEAQALDADLAAWAAAPLPALAAIDVAAITAQRQLPPQDAPEARRFAGWRPALLAASLAMMLATVGWLAMPAAPDAPSPIASVRSPSAVAAADEADLAFAYVFTPTAVEEDLI
ncbi:hypothetical protein [Sandarakinorhabdus rubra]|uniref:hypothetical protein n=1 Tax=Sandarakinorhabdus rubra TaxID=2672568 RepID=UPI0013DAE15A|nr:hypothetical protein [Sandarakinorhabdus rubra]